MSNAFPAPPPKCDTPDGAKAAQDWARSVVERQLAILGQLAEDGLQIVQAIKRQAMGESAPDGAAAPEVFHGDLALAYARVARAVRMTLLLQSKLIADLQAFDKGAVHLAAYVCARTPNRAGPQKERIGRTVGRIAQAQFNDDEVVELMTLETVERLEHDELYGDVLARPASEIIAQICRDLDLEPDWAALAQEAWARDEMASGAVGSPLAGLMAEDRRGAEPGSEPPPLRARAASP